MPILRHLVAWAGVIPASPRRLLAALQSPDPSLIMVTPGGIAEMFVGEFGRSHATSFWSIECVPISPSFSFLRSIGTDTTEHAFVKSRKGFVRYALTAGVDLIPTYYLGNSKLFIRGVGNDSFLARLSRRVRASLIPFYGRGGLPIPFRQRSVVYFWGFFKKVFGLLHSRI
jgi:hypothetical protein